MEKVWRIVYSPASVVYFELAEWAGLIDFQKGM